MRIRIATACYREIGAELRAIREATGMSEAELARTIGWSSTKVSRVETGHTPISQVDLVHYLAYCGVYLKDAHDLLAKCRVAEAKLGYWLKPHQAGLPDSACALIFHESTASSSISYEPEFVPGLLQTEAYIRAVLTEKWPNFSDIDFAVRVRKDRQRILHRARPARFAFYVHERALRLAVGDPATMQEQLVTLLLYDGLSHVDVRVVPDNAAFGGAFRMFGYARHKPLAYLDGAFGGFFLEDSEYVERYNGLASAIADIALDGRQSREVLAAMASDYDREEAYDRVEEK
jgi:transcriptional regulator with XRE-family HTH domain